MTTLAPSEQADRLNLRRGRVSGGVNYVRRTRHAEKDEARGQVLRLFSNRSTGGRGKPLSILTMPGLDWRFEKSLIHMREHGRGRTRPRWTFITAIENSPPIYTAALRRAPGAPASISTAVECPAYAQAAARTFAISRYYLADFETMALADPWVYDAAWIDLTGPLTLPRIAALSALWPRLRSRLIVTSLNARWPAEVGQQIRDAGGVAPLLMNAMPGSLAIDEVRYMDTSPMTQVTFARLYGEVTR